MARLREHDDGRTRKWEVQWSVEEGRDKSGRRRRKHFSQSFRTKERAEAFQRQKEDQAASGDLLVDPRQGRRPLQEWAEQWFTDWEPTVKESTAAKSRGLLDCSVLPALGYLPLRKIEPQDVQAWINRLAEPDPMTGRRLKPATVKHHYLVLKSVLDYAMQRGALATSPTASVKLPTNKRMGMQPRKHHFLTVDQVEALADAFATPTETYTPDPESPYPLMIRFLAWTGLRTGEMSGLNVGDVDLDRWVVLVERARRKLKGGEWFIDTTKSGKWREVPIDAVFDDLAEYLDAHPHKDDPDAPLWPGRKTIARTRYGSTSALDYGKPWDAGNFYQRHFNPALERAGLPAALRLHDLRHTFASLCSSHGLPAQQVAAWMGHQNVTVTLTIYDHLFQHDTVEHARKLGVAARKARTKTTGNVTRLNPRAGA